MFEYLVVMAILSGQEASGTDGCRLIPDDAERLACYDRTFGHPAVGAAVAAAATTPKETAPVAQDFGLSEEQRNQKKKEPAPTIDMIESRIAAIERLPRDRFTLTLDNGQKWTQLEPTPIQRFRVGDAITIRKAAFNSYLAQGPNSGIAVRVRRVN